MTETIAQKTKALIIVLITGISFFFTRDGAVQPYLPKLFVFYCFFCIGGFSYYFYTKKRQISTRANTIFIYILSITIFFLLGITGWFTSPFFYLVILLAFFYAFIFSPFVTGAFVLVLVGLYFYEVKLDFIWSDFITLISLFAVIPSAYYLRSQYLLIAQNAKKILILEQRKSKFKDTADQYLANKITRFAVELRQPVVDIKQVALYILGKDKNTAIQYRIKEISDLTDSILKKLEKFEKETTGRKLVHTKKYSP